MRNKVNILNYLMIITILLLFSSSVIAASVCYNEKYFPAVFQLIESTDGFKARLGGAYSNPRKKVAPFIEWSDSGKWVSSGIEKCHFCETNAHIEKCGFRIPDIPLSNQSKNITDEPSACSMVGNSVWFGINFYRGEGLTGTGGIGRYQLDIQQFEIHRLKKLKDTPIHKVVHDGSRVWAATTYNYECTGHPPALGLIRYDWNKKLLASYIGKNDGPCGFVIHDLLWRKNSLWVATDIGLSRWNSTNDKWIHYIPDIMNPQIVNTKTCLEIYSELLEILPRNETWFDEPKSYYQIFYENLERFRPEIVKGHKGVKKSRK